jgi:Spy/CpxP family protein refolding chaperone
MMRPIAHNIIYLLNHISKMKKIKFLVFVFAIVFLSVSLSNTYAQDKPKGKKDGENKEQGKKLTVEERAERRVQTLKNQVALTDDQVIKVRAIEIEFLKASDEVRMKNKDNREQIKTDIKPLRVKKRESIAAILTDEQKTILKEKKKEIQNKRENMRDKGKGRGKGKEEEKKKADDDDDDDDN